jgi:hypothetical protein
MRHLGSHRTVRFLTAVTPIVASLLLVQLLAGPLSFGGGEKDVLLAFPFLFWSVLYLVISLGLWWRGLSLAATAAWAVGLATLTCGLALIGLTVFTLAQPGA